MLPFILQTTGNLLNGTISNVTNPANLLQYLNNSAAYGGYLGFAMVITIFLIFTISASFRIKIVHALLFGAWMGLISSLILANISLVGGAVVMLFVGIALLATLLALFDHVLHPFD